MLRSQNLMAFPAQLWSWRNSRNLTFSLLNRWQLCSKDVIFYCTKHLAYPVILNFIINLGTSKLRANSNDNILSGVRKGASFNGISNMLESSDIRHLEISAPPCPGFASKSPQEVYCVNGGNLNLTIDILTQLEGMHYALIVNFLPSYF